MARTHRTTTTWAAITLATLVLTGCTGQTPPATKKTSPTPSTPTATPTPTASSVAIAPPRPTAMDDDGPRGAEAAAVYFLELDSYIQATGDTRDWDAMSHPKCKFCANRSEQAHQIADGGYRFSGGDVEATVSHTYARDSATGVWPIDIKVTIAPTTITDSSGVVTFSETALSSSQRIEMLRQSDDWSVIGVGVVHADGER